MQYNNTIEPKYLRLRQTFKNFFIAPEGHYNVQAGFKEKDSSLLR